MRSEAVGQVREKIHRRDVEVKGLLLSGVIEGGPAEEAGLRGGDVIVELAGQTITNIYDYTFALDVVEDRRADQGCLRKGRRAQGNDADAARAQMRFSIWNVRLADISFHEYLLCVVILRGEAAIKTRCYLSRSSLTYLSR